MGDSILNNLFGTGGEDDEEAPGKLATNKRVLYKAVVVDVGLYDPGHEWTQREQIEKMLTPYSLKKINDAPRNSIIARIISDGAGRSEKKATICYPFFPPHLCFPIKAGETVWIINETAGNIDAIPHWICRVPEMMRIDDVNYTHEDRKYHSQIRDITELDELFSNPTAQDVGIMLPGFPNGGNSRKNYTLSQRINTINPFTEISSTAISMAAFQYEPVPRYAKRPGDTVLQGSNNTLICLGTDRGWRWYEQLADESSNVFPPIEVMAADSAGGTIDLVTGRGRYPEIATTHSGFGTSPTSTAPRLIENQRAQVEVDKYPQSNGFDVEGPRNRNPPGAVGAELEGDPDFLSDAARIYISTNTYADLAFGITQTVMIPRISEEEVVGYDAELWKGKRMATTMAPSFPFRDEGNESFIVTKADHVRIIARKQIAIPLPDKKPDELHDPEGIHPPRHEHDLNAVTGTIRIVKEGNKDDDLGLIAIRKDGSIQMSAPKIYIGRAPEDGGFQGEHNQGPGDESLKENDPPEDPGVTQPWVKYQQLEDLFNALFDDIKAFCNKMKTHTTPGYGSPSIQINDACAALAKAAEDRRGEIERLKSKRIFGE
jgi:hypothetical protein